MLQHVELGPASVSETHRKVRLKKKTCAVEDRNFSHQRGGQPLALVGDV